MKKLRLDHLRVTAVTTGGRFGAEFVFSNGLNIIRADNTSGKSTLVNMLLYGLGLEMLLGRAGDQVIKPALKSELFDGEKNHRILESFVDLQVTNFQGKSITMRRHIVGGTDTRLVRVWEGQLGPRQTPSNDFYVGVPGAMQGERGFHKFLTDYIGWNVPIIPTYQGKEVPLYIECVMPLMFIEQLKGWSGIQATTPTRYGIQNVAKAGVEFLLNLDVSEIQRKRRELTSRREGIKSQWSMLRNKCELLAESIEGTLARFPQHPKPSMGPEEYPLLMFPLEEKSLMFDNWIYEVRGRISDIDKAITAAPLTDIKMETAIKEIEDRLLIEQAKLQEFRTEFHLDQNNTKALNDRIAVLESDLVKNQEALRLQRYGSEVASSIAKGACPTCNQPVADSLLDQFVFKHIMPVEQNIDFIKQQMDVAKALLESSLEAEKQKRLALKRQEDLVDSLRRKIRDYKTNLTNSAHLPNQAQLREKIKEEERLTRLERARELFGAYLSEIPAICEKWAILLSDERKIPTEPFSAIDHHKIAFVQEILLKLLRDFGFRSTMDEIEISYDNYRPSFGGFKDVSFEASASDNIRLIWAYTLALQYAANNFDTNHLGFSVFDEPGQQQIDNSSTLAFYHAISELQPAANQVVVATSVKPPELKRLLGQYPANIHYYESHVLQRCNW